MTIISKAAGGLSLISSIHDIHKTALIYSRNKYAQTSSDGVISDSVKFQKADKVSYKDTQRKNWLSQNNFGLSFKEFWAKTSGYVEGFVRTSARYIPNFIFSALAICMNKNHKKIANLSAIVLGGIEAWDFARNSLGVGQRDDYLKEK